MKRFCKYMNEEADRLQSSRHIRTAQIYRQTASRFLRYLGGNDIDPSRITQEMMQGFERNLLESGICYNTVSAYIRPLRAAYNRLVDAGKIKDRMPFRKVFTGVAETRKRAVPVNVVRKIREFKTDNRCLARARDMFLFSFYTRGMSFVDIAKLRKTSIKDGYLNYRRSKTGKMMRVKWEPCMAEIAARYAAPAGSPYLFDFIKGEGEEGYRSYHNALSLINRNVRNLGREIGMEEPLTLYVARHSWATEAYRQDIPLSVISAGMGHTTEQTTRIYLASINTDKVDRANEQVLRSIW